MAVNFAKLPEMLGKADFWAVTFLECELRHIRIRLVTVLMRSRNCRWRNRMTTTTRYSIAVIAFVFVGGITSQALAQSPVSPDRADALKTCWTNTLKKYPWKAGESSYTNEQLRTYENCMFERRQPF